MLMTHMPRPPSRTLQGWAIEVLQEVGAIRECGEHGWMQDGADPHARERALEIARKSPPQEYHRRWLLEPSHKFSIR